MKNHQSYNVDIEKFLKELFGDTCINQQELQVTSLFDCYETCIYYICFNIHCVTQIHVNVKCLYS